MFLNLLMQKTATNMCRNILMDNIKFGADIYKFDINLKGLSYQ